MSNSGIARAIVVAAALGLWLSGCAGIPIIQQSETRQAPAAERVILAQSAEQVKKTPWPTPRKTSLASRITGGGSEQPGRVTRSEAIEIYIAGLAPEGARFSALAADARANLADARQLLDNTGAAEGSTRLSMADVKAVEGAIQALRENRKIYVTAARALEKTGEPVDDDVLQRIRASYKETISALGRAADSLADRVSHNRNEALARPKPAIQNNLTGS